MPIHTAAHHDVVVVGSRCAGAPTAMLLAHAGFDVLVLERAMLPSDTLSTHAIARSGVVQLHRWGLLGEVVASGAPALRDVWFHADGAVTHRVVKDRFGVDHLVAPRRHELDLILALAAADAGAEVRTGATVVDLTRDGSGRVDGVRFRTGDDEHQVRARLVVGADGLRSRVARSVGADLRLAEPATGAVHYAYHRGDWLGLEYHLHDGAFAGVFPTHQGEACTWVCTPADVAESMRRQAPDVDTAFDRMLAERAPSLAERLRGTERTSPVRSALRLPNQLRVSAGPGWALVGDAGYHRDAVTGLGMSDAFRDAELLAASLAEVGPEAAPADLDAAVRRYERQRDERARPLLELTVEMEAFPGSSHMQELQRRLAAAIEEEAARLHAAPLLRCPTPA